MELRRSDRDLPALTVLGLLVSGPRHTYEMHRMMIDFHKDFVTGLPRSMYHSVERLLRDGHIEIVDTVSEGGRPERTVYGLTAGGRAELDARLTRLLAVARRRRRPAGGRAGLRRLPLAGRRPPRRCGPRPRCSRGSVTRRRRGWRAVPRRCRALLLVEVEYAVARLGAEHDWVAGILADIDSGALHWPDLAELAALAEVPPT